jgi:hypothetical protein
VAGFTVARDLDEKLARLITPAVDAIAARVEAVAKDYAPPTQEWITMLDERVRPTHVEVHGQTVPNNLRFILTSMEWDRLHRGLGEYTYMRKPRDESSRAVANIKQCRCRAIVHDDGVAKLISRRAPVVEPGKVTVTVVAEGDWVVPAEFGTIYPGDLVAPGARYMGRAAATVAAELRARH